jgi:hypothetical protein
VTKQTKHGFCENACNMLQLRKGDRKKSLRIALDGRHLVDQAFPLPGQISQVCTLRRQHILGERIFLRQEKLCNDQCVLLVCFGLSQLQLHEVGYEQGVDNNNSKSLGRKK